VKEPVSTAAHTPAGRSGASLWKTAKKTLPAAREAPPQGHIKAVYEHVMAAFEAQDKHGTGFATAVDLVSELRRSAQNDALNPHIAGEAEAFASHVEASPESDVVLEKKDFEALLNKKTASVALAKIDELEAREVILKSTLSTLSEWTDSNGEWVSAREHALEERLRVAEAVGVGYRDELVALKRQLDEAQALLQAQRHYEARGEGERGYPSRVYSSREEAVRRAEAETLRAYAYFSGKALETSIFGNQTERSWQDDDDDDEERSTTQQQQALILGDASPIESQQEYRRFRLHEVFSALDPTGSGEIGEADFFLIGKARRDLGQAKGQWSQGENERYVRLMRGGLPGKVSEEEFIAFHNAALSVGRLTFDQEIAGYIDVARYLDAHTANLTIREGSEAVEM